jgi:hypothetical protein
LFALWIYYLILHQKNRWTESEMLFIFVEKLSPVFNSDKMQFKENALCSMMFPLLEDKVPHAIWYRLFFMTLKGQRMPHPNRVIE